VRVFAIWNRLIRPDGTEITLDSGVTDALGRAGLEGETDNHFAQISECPRCSASSRRAGTYGITPEAQFNSADAYRREVQQSFARTSERVLEPYVNIPPTTTVRQGERIKVFLNRDLGFLRLKAAERNKRNWCSREERNARMNARAQPLHVLDAAPATREPRKLGDSPRRICRRRAAARRCAPTSSRCSLGSTPLVSPKSRSTARVKSGLRGRASNTWSNTRWTS